MHSLGHGGDSKKKIRPFIYLPKYAPLCQTSSSQFENCWPQWHALDLLHHITVKGWEHGAASSVENALLKQAWDYLDRVFPEKENSFVTKATVPLFCCITSEHLRWLVWPDFPEASASLQHTCDSMCCRLPSNKHRPCQGGVWWGTVWREHLRQHQDMNYALDL